MAVVPPAPQQLAALGKSQALPVLSDAPTNAEAIIEIDRWCRANGLVRLGERWLQTRLRDGDTTVLRQGWCRRPDADEVVAPERAPSTLGRRPRSKPAPMALSGRGAKR